MALLAGKALEAYESRLDKRFEAYEKQLQTMKDDLIHKIEREIVQVEELIKGRTDQ